MILNVRKVRKLHSMREIKKSDLSRREYLLNAHLKMCLKALMECPIVKKNVLLPKI